MVTLQILVLPFLVRVRVSQRKGTCLMVSSFYFLLTMPFYLWASQLPPCLSCLLADIICGIIIFALFAPLREFFLADVYCIVYFSPSRKGRKDYIHSQGLCTLCAANVCSVLDNAGIFLLKKEAGILWCLPPPRIDKECSYPNGAVLGSVVPWTWRLVVPDVLALTFTVVVFLWLGMVKSWAYQYVAVESGLYRLSLRSDIFPFHNCISW